MSQQLSHNLNPSKFFSRIEAETSVLDKLQNLANLLEDRAVSAISWYLGRKEWPKRLSRWIRGLAILLAVAGGLSPLSASAGFADEKLNQLGYIFIALAGAILLTDRYFGFSSSWMRYMTTQMALQRTLEKFQLTWAVWKIQLGGQGQGENASSPALSPDQVRNAVALLSGFQTEIATLIDQEFQTWVAEFKEQLATLQAAISKDKEEQKPGSIVVSMSAPAPLQGPVSLYIDHQLANQTNDSTAMLTVSPGSHLLTAKANSDGGIQMEGSQAVTVMAGQMAKADIALASRVPA